MKSRWPRTARRARIERPTEEPFDETETGARRRAGTAGPGDRGGAPATPSRAGARRAAAGRTAGAGTAGPRRTRQYADIPRAAGRHAGAADRSVHVEEFLFGQALWSDKRYFRCNTPRQITDIWTSRRIGANPPARRRGATATTTTRGRRSSAPTPTRPPGSTTRR